MIFLVVGPEGLYLETETISLLFPIPTMSRTTPPSMTVVVSGPWPILMPSLEELMNRDRWMWKPLPRSCSNYRLCFLKIVPRFPVNTQSNILNPSAFTIKTTLTNLSRIRACTPRRVILFVFNMVVFETTHSQPPAGAISSEPAGIATICSFSSALQSRMIGFAATLTPEDSKMATTSTENHSVLILRPSRLPIEVPPHSSFPSVLLALPVATETFPPQQLRPCLRTLCLPRDRRCVSLPF
mmetsp:Transcript_917/g.1406  ORF Transcript_917/g.1406 Transcript_917/m.1406 type:complete len:241 (-) Transcript_917:257-979(-)